MKIDPTLPIEAVNVEGRVLPARVVALDVVTTNGKQNWLGLALEYGSEIPFIMDSMMDYGFMVASGRMLKIRNVTGDTR